MGFEFRSEPPEKIFDRESATQIAEVLRTRFGQSLKLGKRRRLFQRSDELPWPAWAAMQRLAAMHLGEAESRHLRAVDAWLGVYLPVATEPEVIPLDAPAGAQIEVSGGKVDPKLLAALGSAVEKLKRDMPAPSLQVASLPAAHAEAAALLSRMGIPADDAALRSRFATSGTDDPDSMATQCLCAFFLAASKAIKDEVPVWLVK